MTWWAILSIFLLGIACDRLVYEFFPDVRRWLSAEWRASMARRRRRIRRRDAHPTCSGMFPGRPLAERQALARRHAPRRAS